MAQWTDGLARYCVDCFVGWPPEQAICWQCGCPRAITRAEALAIARDLHGEADDD